MLSSGQGEGTEGGRKVGSKVVESYNTRSICSIGGAHGIDAADSIVAQTWNYNQSFEAELVVCLPTGATIPTHASWLTWTKNTHPPEGGIQSKRWPIFCTICLVGFVISMQTRFAQT